MVHLVFKISVATSEQVEFRSDGEEQSRWPSSFRLPSLPPHSRPSSPESLVSPPQTPWKIQAMAVKVTSGAAVPLGGGGARASTWCVAGDGQHQFFGSAHRREPWDASGAGEGASATSARAAGKLENIDVCLISHTHAHTHTRFIRVMWLYPHGRSELKRGSGKTEGS